MAHFDLHEQEQLSRLEYFWRDWGKYIIGILVIVIITYLSSVAWNYKTSKDAGEAALLYASFTDATLKDAKSAYLIADKMEQSYPKAEYTAMASIWAAKLAFSNKDMSRAKTYLNWTIKKATDQGVAAIAMLRLADVHIEQKEFKLALNILMQKHDASFDSLFYNKRGDLYLAQNNYQKARDAYKEALAKAGGDQSMVGSIQLKLDALGN
jgi:predicted negative regulator of RcsB-dependent stress response